MARDFDGTAAYVSLNDSSSLRTPTTAITVCVWHRIDVSLGGASASIVHKIANGGLNPYLSYAIKQLSVATGIFRAGISTSGSGSLVLTADTTALTDRLWYAFVLRWY